MFVQSKRNSFNFLLKILTKVQFQFSTVQAQISYFPFKLSKCMANVLDRLSLRLEKMNTEKLYIFRLNLKRTFTSSSCRGRMINEAQL